VSQFLIALLWAPLVLLGVMSLSFVSQVLLGCMGTRKGSALADASSRGCVAVLVPAHNESAGIARTVRSVLPQLRHGDRLLVVADNCGPFPGRGGDGAIARHPARQRVCA